VVLVGRPNVGKSTLLNALAGEEVAIARPDRGHQRATRCARSLQIEGVPVEMTDTAGLPRERRPAGAHRHRARAAGAGRRRPCPVAGGRAAGGRGRFGDDGRTAGGAAAAAGAQQGRPADGGPTGARRAADRIWRCRRTAGRGWRNCAPPSYSGWNCRAGASPVLARQRHVAALQQAAAHLDAALGRAAAPELLAEELRLAGEALGSITGRVVADDLLGEIFGRFCIGK
jgi:tRNA modification GTPase